MTSQKTDRTKQRQDEEGCKQRLMASREAQFSDVRTQLQSLRHLISHSETAQGYFDLFDEFVREYEFGLALETLCDFLVETGNPVDPAVLAQIDSLHKLMRVEDACLEKLRTLT